jgi:hypothetical protein
MSENLVEARGVLTGKLVPVGDLSAGEPAESGASNQLSTFAGDLLVTFAGEPITTFA